MPPAQQWQPPQGQGYPAPAVPTPRERAPRPPGVNPFVGVPWGDYVRDGAAALCLFTALGKPWDSDGDGADHWWVVIAVLISFLSLAVPYVAKSRVVPGLGRDQAQLLKLGLNVPLLVSVFATVVNELVHATDLGEGGVGSGAAIALAGAALAVQPRQADEDPGLRDDRMWWSVASATAVVAVVLVVVTFVGFILRDLVGDAFLLDEVPLLLAVIISPFLSSLVLFGAPVSAAVRRRFDGVVVLAVVGFTTLVVDLLTSDQLDGLFGGYPVERWDTPAGGVLLVGAAGALAVSRPVLRNARSPHPVVGWLKTARLAFAVAGATTILVAISYVLGMVWLEEYPAAGIVSVVLMIAVAALCATAYTMLGGNTLYRLAVVGIGAAVVMAGIVVLAVLRSSDTGLGPALFSDVLLDPVLACAFFSLPGLAICALTVPGAVRRQYGPLLPDRDPPAQTAGAGWQPAPPPPPQAGFPQGTAPHPHPGPGGPPPSG